MAVNWICALKNAPALKKAIDGLVAPGASQSDTVWYTLIKAVLGMAGAFGVFFVLSDQEMKDLAATIPAVITGAGFLLDMIISLRLRMKTKEPLSAKTENKDCAK